MTATDAACQDWAAKTTSAGFDPRCEVPALLARIAELGDEFRDVYEGCANPNFLALEAAELRRLCLRLSDVAFALTATALVNQLPG